MFSLIDLMPFRELDTGGRLALLVPSEKINYLTRKSSIELLSEKTRQEVKDEGQPKYSILTS